MKKLYILPILSLLLLSGCNNQPSDTTEKPMETPKELNESPPKDNVEDPHEDFEVGYTHENPEWESIKTEIEAKTGEHFQSLNLPTSPTDENIVYISTSSNLAKIGPEAKNINKIYSYNIKDKELKEIYKEEPEEDRVLKTIGLEGDKLVLLYHPYDYSPGPCFTPFVNLSNKSTKPGQWSVGHEYLDIKNAEDGLESFQMPQYLLEKGKEEVKKCQEIISENQ